MDQSRVERWLSPARVFLLLAWCFGVAMVFVNPPFMAPDEPAHFMRAFQVSEGGFVPSYRDGIGGGLLPASIGDVLARFRLTWYGGTTSRARILDALKIPLDPGHCVYQSFTNTALYSPVPYLPQAIGIAAGRLLGLPVLALVYMGRLANFGCWVGLVYFALNLMRAFRRPLVLLALMPMSLYEAASLSADAPLNGLAILLLALVCREAIDRGESAEPVRRRTLGVITLVSIGITLAKGPYLPLAGLMMLIPARRFPRRSKWIWVAVILLTNVAALSAWSAQTPGLSSKLELLDTTSTPRQQLATLKKHPTKLVTVPLRTFVPAWRFMIRSFVGQLGWLNIDLSPVFVAAYLGVMALALWPARGDPDLPSLARLAGPILASAGGALEGVTLMLYLFATRYGFQEVASFQGRYFIPLAPSFLVLLGAILKHLPLRLHLSLGALDRNRLTALCAAGSCLYTLAVVYAHYFSLS